MKEDNLKKKKRLWKEESRKIKVSTVHISIEPRRSSGASGEKKEVSYEQNKKKRGKTPQLHYKMVMRIHVQANQVVRAPHTHTYDTVSLVSKKKIDSRGKNLEEIIKKKKRQADMHPSSMK